jgi:hypothetical protein
MENKFYLLWREKYSTRISQVTHMVLFIKSRETKKRKGIFSLLQMWCEHEDDGGYKQYIWFAFS